VTPFAWAVFAVLVVLIVVTFGTTAAGFLVSDHDTARVLVDGRIFSRALVLFLIVPAIAGLCAYDKISGEAALAALAAIAGYILGGNGAQQ
jgi:hypothetical protein